MNKNLLIALGVFIAVIAVGAFLIGRPKTPVTTPVQQTPVAQGTTEAGTPTQEGSSTSAENVREVTVSASEYSFNPSKLTFNKGEKIRLTFTNVGNMPHDFVIDELKVRTKTIGRGKSDTVEFTVEEVGTFAYYCSVGNHRSLGMEGELKVE